jgi:predicted secreted acid phosphatase/endonuclease/exonuclease/phosphatase family metal-dependent hydrolase
MRIFALALGVLLSIVPVAAQAKKLTLASWNFGFLAEKDGAGCFPRTDDDYKLLASYVQRLNADIIAFQEVENAAAAARVFDPAIYDIEIADGPNDPSPPEECRGQPGQFIIPQKAGFAIRKGFKRDPRDCFLPTSTQDEKLDLTKEGYCRLRDLAELSLPEPGAPGRTTRKGVVIAFADKGTEFRLLAVHLKSGCNQQDLPSGDPACGVLWHQRQILENWIDDNTKNDIRTIVIGDFNRQLTRHGDQFWAGLDDSDPSGSDLEVVANNEQGQCGPHDELIDFIVVDKGVDLTVDEPSYRTLKFDQPWERAPADHCPIAVDINFDTGLSRGYRWIDVSAEFEALARKTYAEAGAQLAEIVKNRDPKAKPWIVVLDVDETVLSNLGFERESQLGFEDYSDKRWAKWVTKEKATFIPGASEFLQRIVGLGGKIALVTDRPADLNEKTRENLETLAKKTPLESDLGPDKLCVLGIEEASDTRARNPDEWEKYGYKNNKDRRRRLLQEGQAAACISAASAMGPPNPWAQSQDIVLAVGDNVQDYDHFTQRDLLRNSEPLTQVLGKTFFLLPNPLYGSWRDLPPKPDPNAGKD